MTTDNRQQTTDNRQQTTDNRQQTTDNRQQSVRFNNITSPTDYILPEEYIPYPVRSRVNQIDPRLDVFWQDNLFEIFRSVSAQERKNISTQILVPKKIYWNSEKKNFEYRPDDSCDSLQKVAQDANEQAKHIRTLVSRVNMYLETLKDYTSATQIADLLENVLGQIRSLPVRDALAVHVLKQRLFQEFVYAAAAIIRTKTEIAAPPNTRGLNTPSLKTFINEVYLKQQLMGSWFQTLSKRRLDQSPYPLVNTFLNEEKNVRRLEIVQASKYLFSIAPTSGHGNNPFAVRRFLQEETLFSRTRILLNGVGINTALLANADHQYINRFKEQIHQIITIDSGVSREIVEWVEKLENYHDDTLIPLLFAPLEAGKVDLEQAIALRLANYEQQLCMHILQPLHHALRKMATNQEEYEFLYIGIRQLFGNILSVFRDFQSQPALLGKTVPNIMFGRLVAYAAFLEKRYDNIFSLQSDEEWNANHLACTEGMKYVRKITQEGLKAYKPAQAAVEKMEAKLAGKPSLVGKLLKIRESQEERLKELKKEVREIAYKVHSDIFYMPKNLKENTVHLEFDSLLITDERQRNYAFPDGINGITKLPRVISLPEYRSDFNLPDFMQELEEPIEKWRGSDR